VPSLQPCMRLDTLRGPFWKTVDVNRRLHSLTWFRAGTPLNECNGDVTPTVSSRTSIECFNEFRGGQVLRSGALFDSQDCLCEERAQLFSPSLAQMVVVGVEKTPP
jgi:hypothetical protein